jgi:hypothetical protein
VSYHAYGALTVDPKVVGAIKPTTKIAVSVHEKYEAVAKEIQDIDPTGTLKAYFAIQAIVLQIAKELGIDKEVKQIFHAAAAGSMVGAGTSTAAVYATAVATTGSAVGLAGSAALASAAAMGMVAGGLVGAVAGIISLFDSDDENEARRKARVAARKAMEAYMLSRLDLNGLIKEQQNTESYARSQAKAADFLIGAPSPLGIQSPMSKLASTRKASLLGMADKAQKLAALFITVGDLLKPQEVEWFVATANIARWEQFVARYEKQLIPQTLDLINKFSKPPYTSAFSTGPNFMVLLWRDQLKHYLDLTMQLRMKIVAESQKLPKAPVQSLSPSLFTNVLKPTIKATPMLARSGTIVQPISTSTWVMGALVVAAAAGGGYYLYKRRKVRAA